ncbi:hypothetical protein [Nocardia sp. XZ_19_231]|uniref:hypothetical protein n=1 Tax=Nocardia sp. XZ_19_231 TaxID=2769252 RepID=UPI00188FB2F4|nr:hypothetical protein [Nocardia sp. XZ_19_231]
MSAPTSEHRLLRPRYIHFAAGRLWVIDETQPIAVLLEPNSGQIDRIVSWPEIPSPSPTLTVASHEDSVWVRYCGTDVLACVTVDGVHHVEYFAGTHLLTAGSSGVWCFRPARVRDDIARTADEPPLHSPQPGPPLLPAHPGGGTSPIEVGGVVVAADFDEVSVRLGVEHARWSRIYRDTPTPAGYVLQQSKSWIHLDAKTIRIGLDDYPRSRADGVWHTSEYADWHWGMHDVQAEFIGEWPHGRLHFSFTHDDYEGLTLVTRLNLYDENVRRLDDMTRYVPTDLMEQADTRAYPDRSHVIGGVLYV